MGAVLKPIGSVFGIGQKDDPTFQPGQTNTAAYTKFSQENPDSIDGVKGTQIATDQVKSGINSSLYGDGGLQSQLSSEGNKLATQGYQLTPEDNEAYGQASGNITRQFGQQDNDIAKSLAARG